MIVLKCRRNGGDLLAFGPDSRMLASRSETGLQVWRDLHSNDKPLLFREVRGCGYLRFSPDSRSLYFDGAVDGVVDLSTSTVTRYAEPPDGDRYSALSFDGRHILSVKQAVDLSNNTVACWPSETSSRESPFGVRGYHVYPAAGPWLSREDGFCCMKVHVYLLFPRDAIGM